MSRSLPGEGNGNPPRYSCLENPMDRGAWWAIVHGVARVRYDLATESSKSHNLQHYISFFIPTWRRKTGAATKFGEKEDTESLCIYHLNLYNQAPPNVLPHLLCTCSGSLVTSDWGTELRLAEGFWYPLWQEGPGNRWHPQIHSCSWHWYPRTWGGMSFVMSLPYLVYLKSS